MSTVTAKTSTGIVGAHPVIIKSALYGTKYRDWTLGGRLEVTIQFLNPLLGSQPDHDIKQKQNELEENRALKAGHVDNYTEEEGRALAAAELISLGSIGKGTTGFNQDADGNAILLEYIPRGFLKAAFDAMGQAGMGSWGFRTHCMEHVFVHPVDWDTVDGTHHAAVMRRRGIPLFRVAGMRENADCSPAGVSELSEIKDTGVNLAKMHLESFDVAALASDNDLLVRPVMGETKGVKHVAISASQMIEAGAVCAFEVVVTPNGFGINLETIVQALAYGEHKGLGQWRTAGYGAFQVVGLRVVQDNLSKYNTRDKKAKAAADKAKGTNGK